MRVQIPDENRVLTTEDFRLLAEAINANVITGTQGIEVRSTGNGVCLSAIDNNKSVVGRVYSYTPVTDYKWQYVFAKVNPRVSSSDVDMTDSAWVDTEDTFVAYNLTEDMNVDSESGVVNIIGNGVDVSDTGSLSSTSMTPQPAPVGFVAICTKISGVWWFAYENGIDGEC